MKYAEELGFCVRAFGKEVGRCCAMFRSSEASCLTVRPQLGTHYPHFLDSLLEQLRHEQKYLLVVGRIQGFQKLLIECRVSLAHAVTNVTADAHPKRSRATS